MNPRSYKRRDSTLFDQPFCLILNVAVGSDGGLFEYWKSSKPWVKKSLIERLEFRNARDPWLPTLEEGGQMVVKKMEMWQWKGYRRW